ncbi:hypothetical protein ACEQPO_13625 [Bacillus sp. SL00103]
MQQIKMAVKLAVAGKNMMTTLQLAIKLGYVTADEELFVPVQSGRKWRKKRCGHPDSWKPRRASCR